jgi:cell division FtsZ-interacting protein ZapD
VTHPLKELKRYDRRLQTWIHTAGAVTAEVYTICQSRLEHEFATDTPKIGLTLEDDGDENAN